MISKIISKINNDNGKSFFPFQGKNNKNVIKSDYLPKIFKLLKLAEVHHNCIIYEFLAYACI